VAGQAGQPCAECEAEAQSSGYYWRARSMGPWSRLGDVAADDLPPSAGPSVTSWVARATRLSVHVWWVRPARPEEPHPPNNSARLRSYTKETARQLLRPSLQLQAEAKAARRLIIRWDNAPNPA